MCPLHRVPAGRPFLENATGMANKPVILMQLQLDQLLVGLSL